MVQLIYISIRPNAFKDSLEFIQYHFKFSYEVIVFCPGNLIPSYEGVSNVTVIDEKDLLNNKWEEFTNTNDHAEKNYLLRSQLAFHDAVNEEFIISDDDYRPLRDISIEYFLDEGKYRSYYFMMLNEWFNQIYPKPKHNPYDTAHFNELVLFRKLGLPLYAFSSHMPQMFNKEILKESVEFFEQHLNEYVPLEEWNTYFNYGLKFHPDKFHNPQVFTSLCWPRFPMQGWDWPSTSFPKRFDFENFYMENYVKGGYFSALPNKLNPERNADINKNKINIYSALIKRNITKKEPNSFKKKIRIARNLLIYKCNSLRLLFK